ncbi:hypothetical protein A1507_21700 [Methylomonas koyamae]|uniref:Uncharacterized protein n=1 Tax=Methylomonas koyamae TaxID=702114 RepID=A0A177MX60_9GAMM|nr:hypothetical protein A1507_21700 [Methylomonas koyamae]
MRPRREAGECDEVVVKSASNVYRFNEAPAGGRGMQRGLEAMIGAACAGRLRGLRKTAVQL